VQEIVSAIYIPQLVVALFEEKVIIKKEILKARKKVYYFGFQK